MCIKISTDDLTKTPEFSLENNYFEFNGKAKKQVLGTAIGFKFPSIRMYIYEPS